MRYVSSRGEAPVLSFSEVLLAGLARDGGLYVPESWPRFEAAALARLASLSYTELAVEITRPFVGGAIPESDYAALVAEAYAGFSHPEVAPMRRLRGNEWLLELFHGPTLAFKDYALQLVGRLFDDVLKERGERVTIIGATSGDTGSAAIAACRGSGAMDIFMLHPKGRISEIQRLQMTTVDAPNVFNIAIEGTFDDCQNLVKAMFNDRALRERLSLSTVNSINWARIMAQIVYYFWAALRLGAPEDGIAFAVPTGNFGNVYAGYAARKMGLPISQIIVGSNHNDILTRFFEDGRMEVRKVVPSLSPSMDIQVASNFERLLFDLSGGDGAAVERLMEGLKGHGRFAVGEEVLEAAREVFAGHRSDDGETTEMIRRIHSECGIIVDPHTAVGIRAGRARRRDPTRPLVSLATAHPGKFPEAVARALGSPPEAPPRLKELQTRGERCAVLPNEIEIVGAYIRERAAASAGARQGAA